MRAPTRNATPPAGDVLLAVALTAVSLPLLWLGSPRDIGLPEYAGPSLLAAVISASMTLPLAWRRIRPVSVLLVVATATVVASAWPIPYVGLGPIVAVYTVAAHRPRRDAVLALLGMTALILVAMVLADAMRFLAGNAVVFSAAWLAGDWRRLQLARAEELRRRSNALVRARHERAQLAVRREREHIATELRDVLAHGVAEMVTQAQAAARLLEHEPARAGDALAHVESSGRACLGELRRLVGLLRQDDLASSPAAQTDTAGIGDVAVTTGGGPARTSSADDGGEGDGPGSPADRGRWNLVSGVGLDRWRQRVARLPVLVQDLALALIVLVVELPLQWLARPGEPATGSFGGPSFASVALVVVLVGTLVWRRRAPQVVVAATLGLSLLVVAWSVPAQLVAPLVALYTVAAHRPRRVSVPWLAVTVLVTVGVLAADGSLGLVPGQLAVFLTLWLLGDWQRVRRDYEEQLELRNRQLERARAREAELAVGDERTRIARELHDVVAQTVGVMLVQASGARAAVTTQPAQAAEAIEHVLDAGRDSLRWLREIVEVLGEEPGGYAPQPGLEDLEDLLAGFRVAGLAALLDVEGTPVPVPRGVSLSAYRIVQESLTNVLKHAEADSALVTVHYGTELRLEILDDGRGPTRPDPHDAGGGDRHGLVGMAERARLVGGELETGARPGGGFRVTARLPASETAWAEPVGMVHR